MFSDEILDIYAEASVGGYFLGLGGGMSQVFSYGDPNFGGATSVEVGKGIGIEIMGVGLEAKKAISRSSDDTVAMEYYITGTILGVGEGLSFHVDSVIIRPSEQLSQVLTQGGEDVWLELFDFIYSSGVVSVDMNFLGTVPRHESFDYDGIIPVHLVTTGSLDN
jgi:hypothetical protein